MSAVATSDDRRRSTVLPYVWVVNTAGCVLVVVSLGAVFLSRLEPLALLLTTLAWFSGFTVLRLRSVSASFSLGDAFTLSALFLYGPEFGTLAVALDTVAISFRLGGAPHRVLFNTAAPSLAMGAAGWITFGALGLPLPSLAPDIWTMVVSCAVAVLLFFLIGSGLVASAVALDRGTRISTVWREHFAGLWVSPAAGGYIGMLVALLSREIGPAAVLAVLPLPIIVYQMLRTSLGRTDDQLRHLEEMNRTYASTIEAFATAVDAKDQVTHGHLRRVQGYALGVARELGITDVGTLRSLEAAALLHDVGKIGVPEHILNKPGKLAPAEFEEMKRHVTIGADILSAVDFPFPVVPIVRHHHENWDGTGYPDGVRGTDIPIGARILMVVDCFDALTSDRPYRPAMSRDEAFDILRARRGRMYDPQIVDLFIGLQPRLAQALGLDAASAPSHTAMTRATGEARQRSSYADEPPAVSAEPLARLLGDLLSDCLSVIYQMDASGAAIVARAARGPWAREVIGHRLALGHGVSGWVCANQRAIDDTDAVLDLGGLIPAADIAPLSCTSVHVSLAGRPVVVTVYGPRAGAAHRVALVRSISQYVSAGHHHGSQASIVAPGMAKAS